MDYYLLSSDSAGAKSSYCKDEGSSFHGATLNNNNIPGIAMTVQKIKKLVQPIESTMKPTDALAKVLGTAINAVNKANWVAVYFGCVERAINAVNAAVPSPTPRYSMLITIAKATLSSPSVERMTKPIIAKVVFQKEAEG